jgi:GT2 family glycosyltransferase
VQVWVVENESLPAQGPLEQAFHRLRPDHNLGYAGGVNLALHKMVATCDFVVLMNADVDADEATVQALWQAMQEDAHLGMIGPLLEETRADGTSVVYAGGRNPVWHPLTRKTRPPDAPSGTHPIEVDYTPGTVCLIRTDLLHQIGFLHEPFFFSGELADLGWRARQAGYSCRIHSGVRVRHRTAEAGEARNTLYLYYSLRNRFLLARRCYPMSWPLAWLFWTAVGSLMVVKHVARGAWRPARATARALCDGWRKEYGRAPDGIAA